MKVHSVFFDKILLEYRVHKKVSCNKEQEEIKTSLSGLGSRLVMRMRSAGVRGFPMVELCKGIPLEEHNTQSAS